MNESIDGVTAEARETSLLTSFACCVVRKQKRRTQRRGVNAFPDLSRTTGLDRSQSY
jgi:hypothetical protein